MVIFGGSWWKTHHEEWHDDREDRRRQRPKVTGQPPHPDRQQARQEMPDKESMEMEEPPCDHTSDTKHTSWHWNRPLQPWKRRIRKALDGHRKRKNEQTDARDDAERPDQEISNTHDAGSDRIKVDSDIGNFNNLIGSGGLTDDFWESDYIVLQWCAFYTLAYIGVAVLAFSFVFESWTIIDSVYFAVSTFTTVGYGDKEPKTVGGKLFTIGFAIYGVLILGLFIGIVGHTISETQSAALLRMKRVKRRHVIRQVFAEGDNDEDSDDDNDESRHDPLHPPSTSNSNPQPHPNQKTPLLGTATASERQATMWEDHTTLLIDVWTVVKAELPALLLVVLMALFLGWREQWSPLSSLYFAVMSASTTGFGDYTPHSQIDKLYCVIFLPLSVAVFGELLGRIATVYITRKRKATEERFLTRTLNMIDLERMDSDKDGTVDELEFLSFMLVHMRMVDKEALEMLKTIFRSLDTDGNRRLDKEDLVELTDRNQRRLESEWLSESTRSCHGPIAANGSQQDI